MEVTALRGAALWGLRPPHPGVRGVSPPGASDFFDAEKVTKKAPGTPRSPIFCPIGLYQWGNFSATELGFCHLICGGSIDDASAAALLKRDMFLLALDETWFFRMHPREHPKDNRTGFIYAGGFQRGRAPFVSSRGRGT